VIKGDNHFKIQEYHDLIDHLEWCNKELETVKEKLIVNQLENNKIRTLMAAIVEPYNETQWSSLGAWIQWKKALVRNTLSSKPEQKELDSYCDKQYRLIGYIPNTYPTSDPDIVGLVYKEDDGASVPLYAKEISITEG